MTRHLRLTSAEPLGLSDAQREAQRYTAGRDIVSANELAGHFVLRGWSIGDRRAGHILASLGWSRSVERGGFAVFRRPSPIADGSWRRRAQPWFDQVEKDPDLIAAEDRRRRWNLAVLVFAVASVLAFLGELARWAL